MNAEYDSRKLFTSESVTEGHPDKLCDRISDAVLDAVMAQDPNGRVACECYATTGMVVVGGEITTNAYIDIPGIVRNTVCDIGYDRPEAGFDGNTCAVLTAIDEQSPDIALGTNDDVGGAGDQGMMFGYACKETPDLMPLPITMAHELAYALARERKAGNLPDLLPDGKTQVTVEYAANGTPVSIPAIIISSQHLPDAPEGAVWEQIKMHVIDPFFERYMSNPGTLQFVEPTQILVNPTGRFVKGGPAADTGLTGRKIIVDTYGGYSRHGGGAFSGKDPTKVDRSAAYLARYIAKNVVATGLAGRCEIQIAYAIGVADPVSIRVDTFGTCEIPEGKWTAAIRECFGLRPGEIIRAFDLRRPIYTQTSAYGHFGMVIGQERPWEQTDKVSDLLAALSR